MPPHENVIDKYVAALGTEIGQIQAHIWSECVQLHNDLSEFRYLFSSTADIDLLNATAPRFFLLLQALLVQRIILGLCRITDPSANKHQKNLSLKGAIAAIKTSSHAPSATLLETKVLDYERSLDFARKHRDKHYAHTDLNIRLKQQVTSLPAVTHENIVNAVQGLGVLVNEMDMELGLPPTLWNNSNLSSRRLMMLVKRGLEQEKEDREDRMNGLVRIPIDDAFMFMALNRSDGNKEAATRWLKDAIEERLKLLANE